VYPDGAGASANRTCTARAPAIGDWVYGEPGYPWAYNHCAQSWLLASCLAHGGTVPPGALCTQPGYCQGATVVADETNMASIANDLINIWKSPCVYSTSDSGWGYSGTIVEDGYSATIGPDVVSSEGIVTSTFKLRTRWSPGRRPARASATTWDRSREPCPTPVRR
jgi:hypothetical protein